MLLFVLSVIRLGASIEQGQTMEAVGMRGNFVVDGISAEFLSCLESAAQIYANCSTHFSKKAIPVTSRGGL
jgi:hypothetical protein